MSKASSLDCFYLPARQLKRKYATPQRCRNYKSIQECSVHGDIHLFASVQPTAECHSLQDESSSQSWSQGNDARTLLTSWHLHVTPLCHQDSKKGFSPFQHKGYLTKRRHYQGLSRLSFWKKCWRRSILHTSTSPLTRQQAVATLKRMCIRNVVQF